MLKFESCYTANALL